MSEANPIRNVSDTALWVAIYRAMESERPDALFRDPYARRLGGARGEAILHSLPQGQAMAWSLIVRTAVMDEVIRDCVAQGARCVLNLAAGLDARPYRLNLPADLQWLHVDMPDMVDYFRRHMQNETPRCQVDFIAADLRDTQQRHAVLARAAGHGPLLVISEGLLIYLEPGDVAALARDLATVAQARWWLFDLTTPLALRYAAPGWRDALEKANAPFRFLPREGTAFFAPLGWRESQFRSTWEESLRLRRPPRFAWLLRLLYRLQPRRRQAAARRMSGIALLESASS
jgi:methyltransferase (TIGR00027 family)